MLPPGAPAAGLGPARAAAAGRDGDAPLDGARRPGPLRDGSGLRDRLFREPAHGERRGPRARRPLRRAAGRRAARARPVDEPASRAVPCGRGFPRDVRRRRFRRSAVLAARRRGRRPPGDDGTRPPGGAAAPRARVPRARPGGRGRGLMNRARFLACLVPLLARAEPPAPLAGRVTDAAGRPVVGALVTARHLELARETTVYADGDGRWTTPPLEPGRYHLRARRPGFRDRTEVVELADATPGNKVLVLERETDPRELAWQLPANRWLALAVAHLPDDAAREEFLRQCTFCHQQGSWATRVQRDPEEWRKIFALMARMGGILSTRVRSGLPEALNAAYAEASYVPALGEHFAPPPPPDAVAARAVITEWEVGGTGSMQHDITVHPDGRVYSVDTTQDKLYRLDPRSGERRTYRLPARTWGETFAVRAVPWLLWLGRWVPFNPEGGGDAPQLPIPYGIDIAPDGGVWFSQLNAHRIGRLDPETGDIRVIDTPFSAPRRLRFDSRGNLWIPGFSSGVLARFDPRTVEFHTWDLPIQPRGSGTPSAIN